MTVTEREASRVTQLGMPLPIQLEFVSRRLKEVYKLDFPITRDAGGVAPLSSHKIQGHVLNFLHSAKGYEIELRSEKKMLIRTDIRRHGREVTWWLNDAERTIGLEAWWSINPKGVRIVLETRPTGGNGNEVEATMLARDLRECGERIGMLASALVAADGEIIMHWDDLLFDPK